MKNGDYTLITAPTDYPGKRYRGRYAYEHHVVWWRKHGSVPSKGYEIHHKDMNHRNNRISNLQLLTGSDHRKLHGFILQKRALIEVKCANCWSFFKRRGNTIRKRAKKNSRGLFCSKICADKANTLYARGRHTEKWSTLICARCTNKFERLTSDVRRKGQRLFCSRKCFINTGASDNGIPQHC